jgi:hypothetical protein
MTTQEKIKNFDYYNFIKEYEIEEGNIYAWAYRLFELFEIHGFYLRIEYEGNDIVSHRDVFIFEEKSFEKIDVYANDACPDFETIIGRINEIDGNILQYIGIMDNTTSVIVFAF